MNIIEKILEFGLPALALLMLAEGLIGRKRSANVTQFYLMDGKLPAWPYIGTFASTNFSLGNVIFLSMIWGAFYGIGGLFWLIAGFILAASVFSYCLSHYPAYTDYIEDKNNSGSIHEFLYQRLSRNGEITTARKLRLVASATTVICLLLALALELTLAASILSPLISVSPIVIFICLSILIAVYSSLGGFWSVVWTDLIQGVLLTLSFTFLCYALFFHSDIPVAPISSVYPTGILEVLYAPKWQGILAILTITAGWYLVTMDTWQRACATRNSSVTNSGLWKGTIIICFGIVVFVMLGMYDFLAITPSLSEADSALASGGINPITDLYLTIPYMPVLVQASIGFVVVGLVMAGLSTADTMLIIASHSLVSDLLVGIRRGVQFGDLNQKDSRQFAVLGRIVTVALGFAVILTYFLISSLGLVANALNLFFVAYSIPFALLIPVVHAMRSSNPNPKRALYAMIAGFIIATTWGFGFATASANGFAGISFATADELLYLNPLVTTLGSLAMFLVIPRGEKTNTRTEGS